MKLNFSKLQKQGSRNVQQCLEIFRCFSATIRSHRVIQSNLQAICRNVGWSFLWSFIVYTWLIKRCRVQSINHERCDTMEFWEDSTGKLATQFYISTRWNCGKTVLTSLLLNSIYWYSRYFHSYRIVELNSIHCSSIYPQMTNKSREISRFLAIQFACNLFHNCRFSESLETGLSSREKGDETGN